MVNPIKEKTPEKNVILEENVLNENVSKNIVNHKENVPKLNIEPRLDDEWKLYS